MERKELVKIYITKCIATMPVEASTKKYHQAAQHNVQRCAEPPDDAFYMAFILPFNRCIRRRMIYNSEEYPTY